MNPLYSGLLYFVWFLSTYFVVLILLVLLTNTNKLFENKKFKHNGNPPAVSIIVPAYNEEKKIADTIDSLKKVNYDNVSFIIVNDGSTDQTCKVARDIINGDPRFLLLDNKDNKGKAARLNQGINISKSKYIACMDADSIVEPDIFNKTLEYFSDNKVGAVTVSVKVRNPKTLLHKIIDVEYILGLSLFLKLFSKFNCVFVTPGPFSIYRRDMLMEIGGFDEKNIVEDLEIAYRIHKAKYKIKNCMEAKVETILPENFKGLYIQRKRWYSGSVHTFFQHKNMLLKSRFGHFSFFMPLNHMLIFFGLLLFFFTTYLGITNIVENLTFFYYTDFNFWEKFLRYEFDILAMGKLSLLGLSAFIGSVMLMVLGLKFSRVEYKKNKLGILGFPLMFFLYQIFWIGSYASLFKGKNIKWR